MFDSKDETEQSHAILQHVLFFISSFINFSSSVAFRFLPGSSLANVSLMVPDGVLVCCVAAGGESYLTSVPILYCLVSASIFTSKNISSPEGAVCCLSG